MNNEIVLLESKTLRSQYAGRVDVLDKVKALSLLPDGVHATTDIVATYYEVGPTTIRALVTDHRDELEANGYSVLRGQQLRDFKSLSPESKIVGSRLALWSRRAILNVGQLLRDSEVARAVRTYLLEVEEVTPDDLREAAILRMVEKREYKSLKRFFVLGLWGANEYRIIQGAIYQVSLGMSAGQLRQQPQTTGALRKRGEGFIKSHVAKDHLTDDQRDIVGDVVSTMLSVCKRRYPQGMTLSQALLALEKSAAFIGVGRE